MSQSRETRAIANDQKQQEEEVTKRRKRKRVIDSPTDDVTDEINQTNLASSSSSSSSSSFSAHPSIETHEFTAKDFDHLSSNEYARYLGNSDKVGHAVIIKNEQGEEIALQYNIPQGTEKSTPTIRPLINIEAIERYGLHRFRATTPTHGTKMYAKRFIDLELTDEKYTSTPMQIACFSPSASEQEPFWGGKEKETPLFREDLAPKNKEELDKEIQEIKEKTGNKIKAGNELIIDHESVRARDNIKTRTPDQNTVMGGESARDTYEYFLETWQEELHPEMIKVLQRAVKAPLREAFKSNYRPEWLHAEGFGLTPTEKNPQVAENLGAAPKWANTEMMVLERIAKWFALNRPKASIRIKPLFEMLLDSELIKKIEFSVNIEEEGQFIKFLQTINPFKQYPLFRKASDIAQGTAIAYQLLYGTSPASQQGVLNPAYKASASSTPATAASFHVSSSSSALSFPIKKSKRIAEDALSPKKKKAKLSLPPSSPVEYEKSIVQILTTSQEPDYDQPWMGTHVGGSSGTGLVIEHHGKKYILTNAHCVENMVRTRIRFANTTKKYEVKPKCVSYQCDLALLEVDDPEFLHIAKPLELGDMVRHKDKVLTVGFPMGGDEISVSKGIVSRIEVRDYCMSGLDMLQVQIDAAINPGNSGGPVLSNNKVVGVAFQGYDRQGLGFMIPPPVIWHFLTEALSGKKYRGFPILPVNFETLENPSLRKHYGMTKEQTGIRVSSVNNLCDAFNKLKPDDILLEIDSLPISNQGTVDIPDIGKRIDLLHVTHMKYIGDTVQLKVLRKNEKTKQAETHHITVKLDHVPLETEKVPQTEHDKMPTYYINSGIVFIPLTRNYLEGKGGDLEDYRENGSFLTELSKKLPDEQIIVINDILDCENTEGYEKHVNAIITEINGKPINNIHDAIAAMENNPNDLHCITTHSKNKIVVKNMAKAEQDALLKQYNIKGGDRSEDLLPEHKIDHLIIPKNASSSSSSSSSIPCNDVTMEEKQPNHELTLEDLPGARRYRAKLDQMEQLYSQYPLDEDEDLSYEDIDEDENYDEEEEEELEEGSTNEDKEESEESAFSRKEKTKPQLKYSNKFHFFYREKDSSHMDIDQDNEIDHKHARYK